MLRFRHISNSALQNSAFSAYIPIRRQSNNQKSTDQITIRSQTFQTDTKWFNVSKNVTKLLERGGMHHDRYHPIGLLSTCIQNHFNWTYRQNGNTTPTFTIIDNLHPVVTTKQQFDSLLITEDHVARSKTDNYYINEKQCLRAHTSAHQVEIMKQGLDTFLVFGDVYRRDEIDATHYPAFHQLEGVRLFTEEQLKEIYGLDDAPLRHEDQERSEITQAEYDLKATLIISEDLKRTLLKLVQDLLGDEIEYRWNDDFFPFTHPSYELEVFWKGEWMEVLGCGVIEHQILKNSGCDTKFGWAFGIGLERLAMLMFEVPDIRMLWTEVPGYKKSITNLISNLYDDMGVDPESYDFSKMDISKVRELRMPSTYAKNPPVTQNMSFFMGEGRIVEPNDVYDVVREVAGEFIESVRIQDEFFHPTEKKKANMYELIFRCPTGEKFTNAQAVAMVDEMGRKLVDDYGIVPRWEIDGAEKESDTEKAGKAAEKERKLAEKAAKRAEKNKLKFEEKQARKKAKIRQSSPRAGPSQTSVGAENWDQRDGFGFSDDEQMEDGTLNQTVVPNDKGERENNVEKMVSREEFSQFIENSNLTKTKINNITKVFNETVELDEQLKKLAVSKGTTADRNTLSKNLAKLKKSLKTKMGVIERDSASNRSSSRNKE